MTSRLLALSGAVVILSAGPGFPPAGQGARAAQEGEASRLLSRLREKYNDVENLSLRFTQTTVFAVSRAEQETAGSLVMGRGNRYRVDLGERTIVSDGKSVWSWSKANDQVIVDLFRDDPAGTTPERLLTRIPDDYHALLTGSGKVGGKETTILKLTPGKPGTQVKWIKLWVDEDGPTVLKLQVHDLGDNDMTYLLRDVEVDGEVPDSVFSFTAPPGAEVLDLR